MGKVSGVYKILNTATGDFYIGSSKNVLMRWANHKCSSTWKRNPNNPLYKDFQKYGLDKFSFQIIALVEPEHLTQVEQEFIELLRPTYNDRRSKGRNVERYKESNRKYRQSDKCREAQRKAHRKYYNQFCLYNGETLTLNALAGRFFKAGIEHPTLEAKKYLLDQDLPSSREENEK